MIPGNLFSIVSSFSNYVTDKIENFYNIESFSNKEELTQKRLIVKIIVYVIIYALLFYPLIYVPYKYIDKFGNKKIITKILLFITYLFFPLFNVVYIGIKVDNELKFVGN